MSPFSIRPAGFSRESISLLDDALTLIWLKHVATGAAEKGAQLTPKTIACISTLTARTSTGVRRDKRSTSRPEEAPMEAFDYGAVAELYPARGLGPGPQHVSFMRFEHAADAIRFAFEKLSPSRLLGAVLEVGEERF